MLLDRFLAAAEKYQFKPAIAFLPGKGWNDEDNARFQFLEGWAGNNNVPFLDLSKPIFAAGVDKTYIEGNWHWNASGHKVAAEELQQFIGEEFFK